MPPTFQSTKRLNFKAWFRPKPWRSLLLFLLSFLRFPHRLSIKWVWMTGSRGRINTWPFCLKYKRWKGDEISLRLRVCLHRGECLPYVTTTTACLTWSLLITYFHRVHGKCGEQIGDFPMEEGRSLPLLGLLLRFDSFSCSKQSFGGDTFKLRSVEPAYKHRRFSLANWSPPYWKSRMSRALTSRHWLFSWRRQGKRNPKKN